MVYAEIAVLLLLIVLNGLLAEQGRTSIDQP